MLSPMLLTLHGFVLLSHDIIAASKVPAKVLHGLHEVDPGAARL